VWTSSDNTGRHPPANSGDYGESAIFRHFKLESATKNWNLIWGRICQVGR
jgi:hypothetical protein